MKNILVTGGTGYIGSHMVLALIERGFNPIVLDNLSRSDDSNLTRITKLTGKKVEFIQADLRYDLGNLRINEPIDAIVHFAALKAVGESVEKPLEYYNNNVGGTINLLRWAHNQNIKNFIFSSTAAVYGTPLVAEVKEDSPLHPESPYGFSKLFSEQIIKDCNKAWGLNSVVLRYFNVGGNHDDGLIGDTDKNSNNIIPRIMTSHLGLNNFELQIFGNDYETRDGTCIRDYIHVVDLIDAHVKAIEYLDKNSGHHVYNLGTKQGTTVMEIVKSFEKVTGEKLKYTIAPRRAGDAVAICANSDKALKQLGWKAERNIDDMISSSWKWYKSMA